MHCEDGPFLTRKAISACGRRTPDVAESVRSAVSASTRRAIGSLSVFQRTEPEPPKTCLDLSRRYPRMQPVPRTVKSVEGKRPLLAGHVLQRLSPTDPTNHSQLSRRGAISRRFGATLAAATGRHEPIGTG
jgi:hypothetical protein